MKRLGIAGQLVAWCVVWSLIGNLGSATATADEPVVPAGVSSAEAEHAEPHGGGHAGAHQDPSDLGHANVNGGTTTLFPAKNPFDAPEEFKYDLAIYTFVVFLLLLALLWKFAWGPILAALDKREQSIALMIDEAKLGAQKASEQLVEYEQRLAEATEEARSIVVKARQDAQSAGEKILAEARAAADFERQRAVNDITLAKREALQEIAAQGTNLAFSLASKVLGREVTAADHQRLVSESLDQFPSRN